MKKVISVFLTFCFLFNCFAVVSSAANEKPVVNIYLCARSTASPFGHLWIYIENLTRNSYMVGAYLLKPNEGVSIGSWGSKGADGAGVYYNVEAYSAGHYGISGIISVKDSLTKSELDELNKEIKKKNFWEPFIMNCMGFAFHLWNVNCDPFMVPAVFPFIGRLQMLAKCNTSRDLKMFIPRADRVYKQIGGNVLLPVSDKMLKKIM